MAIQTNFTPVPENTLILGANQYYSMDGRKTHVNNNVLVCGRSGSGKTRYLVKPALLQLNGSYVISDPKGSLYKEFKDYFERNNYRVFHMDFTKPEKSLHYNPLANIHNTNDILKVAYALVYNNEMKMVDPYWELQSQLLLSSLIGWLFEFPEVNEEEKTLKSLQELLGYCRRERITGEDGERYNSRMALMMSEHAQELESQGKESWCYKQFCKVDICPDRTYQTILSTCFSKLVMCDSQEILEMLSDDGFDFKSLGQTPTALFVEISDMDRSMDVLSNLYFTQLMSALVKYADDECPNSSLPIPVQFIMDDFATNVKIIGFQNMISNIRSRNISAMIMVQDLSQLSSYFGNDSQTIISNCASCLYLGSTFGSAQEFAKWANRPVHELLNMPIDSCWLFRIGQKPQMVDFIDIDALMLQKNFRFERDILENELLSKEI